MTAGSESPPQIGFFKLAVADLARSRSFYEAAFGMVASAPIAQRELTEQVLKSPDNPFVLTLMQYADGRPLTNGNGYGPLGFFVRDMARDIARAETAGARVLRGPLSFGSVSYVFLESPDGHVIELIDRGDGA